MIYRKCEIPTELEIGRAYTHRQFNIFLLNNEGATILSKSCSEFLDWQDNKLKVLDIIEGYYHTADVRISCYNTPSNINRVYIVE